MRYGTLRGGSVDARLDSATAEELEIVIREVVSSLTVVPEVVWRNPGISPIAMENLIAYFTRGEGPIEELLPVPPSSEDAASRYIAVFDRINRELAPVFGTGRRTTMIGMLVTS